MWPAGEWGWCQLLKFQQRRRGKAKGRYISLEDLPEDLLCQILRQLDLRDKIRLQLVSKWLHARLLRPLPGEGIWGRCNLSGDLKNYVKAREDISPEVSRWLIRRVPYMTHISCDSHTEEAAEVLCGLLPRLSGVIAPATELSVKLDKRRTMELLHCDLGQQPTVRQIDFWRTLSDCLTVLEIEVDWMQEQKRLQPQLLSQLIALTALTFCGAKMYGGWDVSDSNTLILPELRVLHVEGYWGNHLKLECPSLTTLTLGPCNPMPLVSLQSPLQKLDTAFAGMLTLHDGLPLTTFLNLVSLKVGMDDGQEEIFFPSLPLMTQLQTLDLVVVQGTLLQSLPQSLCQVSLWFPEDECWDSQIIPVLQQLSELRELRIEVYDCEGEDLASFSCDLQPFMAMQHLHTLQVGRRHAWTPSSLRALGQLEAELIRVGRKVKIMC